MKKRKHFIFHKPLLFNLKNVRIKTQTSLSKYHTETSVKIKQIKKIIKKTLIFILKRPNLEIKSCIMCFNNSNLYCTYYCRN